MPKARLTFYISAYTLIAIIAVLGLAINIQSIPINEAVQKLQIQIKNVRDENQLLKLHLLRATRVEVVDEKATSELGMSPPEKLMYIKEKDKPNVFDQPTP
ncbi:hypothetical protein EB093_01045 [bacterium]|nr:hypothetical protein [bacterium]